MAMVSGSSGSGDALSPVGHTARWPANHTGQGPSGANGDGLIYQA